MTYKLVNDNIQDMLLSYLSSLDIFENIQFGDEIKRASFTIYEETTLLQLKNDTFCQSFTTLKKK